MKTIWKDIAGYENYYQVSNQGSIRSVLRETKTGLLHNEIVNKKGKVLIPHIARGYLCVSLSKNNKRITARIHRIVAETFIPNPENKKQVNHKNGIKTDNRVENLEWCSCQENVRHAWDNGLIDKEKALERVIAMNLSREIKIAQVEKGQVIKTFDSLTKAEKDTGVKAKNISSVLHNRSKTAGGYEWKLI